VLGVDDGLGVVTLVKGPVGGLHDPAVRVGEIPLRPAWDRWAAQPKVSPTTKASKYANVVAALPGIRDGVFATGSSGGPAGFTEIAGDNAG
jgi:hypothetical protein